MAKWSAKDERQYEHIKDGLRSSGTRVGRAREIAARTVNKTRREAGRTPSTRTQGTGNPRTSLDERTRQELYNIARERNVPGRSGMDKASLIRALRGRQG